MTFLNLRKFFDMTKQLFCAGRLFDEIKINQGRILCELHRNKDSSKMHDYEFKVFSQWGEDGIIQFLTNNIDIQNRTFIEFGVEDFYESNCRFLLMKDNWEGFVIDGSQQNIKRLKSSYFFWRHQLQCSASFITKENIVALLDSSGFSHDLGILSVDIDGVDYFVLEALSKWTPSIIIVEYNSLFGIDKAVTVPYNPAFTRSSAHSSNLYYGASLKAFMHLLGNRGYALVGGNSMGSNAFFVRRELLNNRVQEVELSDCYLPSRFREGRDSFGQLNFSTVSQGRKLISHLPLIDVISGELLLVSDIKD